MTPDRWRQVSKIYNAALAREEQERPAFLHDACAGDESLRREIDSLLHLGGTAGRFLEIPAAEIAVTRVPEAKRRVYEGRQVGACKILSFIGAGGMGEVYRARDTRLGRDVAVKLLREPFISQPEHLARFDREARLLAALNHPHIATIHSLERIDGVPALVMELVEGPTLAERLAAQPLSVSETLDVARQLVDALEAAHAKGIVHRDFKPANVKIAPGNTIKVLDFGLAKDLRGRIEAIPRV